MHGLGRRTLAVALLCAATAGCDKLLEVDLPDAVTEDALDDPGTARLQVNSVMALVECGYSSFAMDAAGMEDNFQRVSGVAGNYSEYGATASGGACDTDVYSQEWIDPFLTARATGYKTWENLNAYADADVANRQQLLAVTALYTAVSLNLFGEHFCEMAIDGGPMLTASQTLTLAAQWVDSALAKITAAGGDFAITTLAGEQTASAQEMAYGLRARIKYANGDLSGAAADAGLVGDGYMAYVLREEGEVRRNMISITQGGGGGTQAAGFLQGPVTLKTPTNAYGISALGSHPVTGTAWPNPVPFTGYLDLAVDAEGRAVDDSGNAITVATMGGGALDGRVTHTLGNTAGGSNNIVQKYPNPGDDMPLVNWREMRLIEAEALGAGAPAVTIINDMRAADGVPPITGTYLALVTSNADRFDDMIIEERRRALWLEGRFWSTKIMKNEKLWFPRGLGDWVNANASYSLDGGVRLLLPADEYQINSNFTLDDRATGCAAGQRPVGAWPASPM